MSRNFETPPSPEGPAAANAGRRLLLAFGVPLATVVAIAAIDYSTGYEIRLAVLYLVPIAIAVWHGGRKAGFLMAALAVVCWLASFQESHGYSTTAYFFWEGGTMVITFAAFAELLQRLRLALARADYRFVRVLDELHACVYVDDPVSGDVLYANRSLLNAFTGGIPPRSGRDIESRLRAERPPRAPSSTGPVAPALADSEMQDSASGRHYLRQAGPIPWSGGRTARLHVLTDVSEQREAERLRRQRDEAAHASARTVVLAELAGALAHEMNQPLVAVAGYTEASLRLLDEGPSHAQEVRSALEKCHVQAVRAGRILNRLRDFVRRRRHAPTLCDANDVMREAVDLAQVELEDAGVAVELDLEGALPPLLIDRVLLTQVAANLLRNAIEAILQVPVSRRVVTISTRRDDEGLHVTFRDRGPGVDDDSRDRLFMPFYSTKPDGLGLGLSICKSIVEAHSGRLWHAPAPGGGAEFHLTVPMEAA